MKKSTLFLASTAAIALLAGAAQSAESPTNTLVYFESNEDLGTAEPHTAILRTNIDHAMFIVGDRTARETGQGLYLGDAKSLLLIGNMSDGQIASITDKFGPDLLYTGAANQIAGNIIDTKMPGLDVETLERLKSAQYTGFIVDSDKLPTLKGFIENLDHVAIVDFGLKRDTGGGDMPEPDTGTLGAAAPALAES